MKINGGQIRIDVGTGEGSHGGYIMGHTSSGKPIHDASHKVYNKASGGDEQAYKGFTYKDHQEAARKHRRAGNESAAGYHILEAQDIHPHPRQGLGQGIHR